ncbi:MAG: hypothetical protein ACP5UC_03760 [Candidatus Micrarchaeia archaeon]
MAGEGDKDSKIVKTSIDSLIEFIKSKGTAIEISTAASALGIAEPIAEQWAKILEEANLIKISYRVGKMFVEPITLSPENSRIVETKIATKRDMLEEEVSMQLKQLDKIGDIIDAAKISAGNAETVFRQKAPEMQQRLNEINKVYENVNIQYKYIQEASSKVEETSGRINKELDALIAKINGYSSSNVAKTIEDLQAKIAETTKSTSEVNGELGTILKEKDKAIDNIRKNLEKEIETLKKQVNGQFEDLNKKVKIAVEQIKEQERQLATYDKEIKEVMQSIEQFNKQKNVYIKEINSAKVYFNDQYSTRRQEIERSIGSFEKELKDFNSSVDNLKKSFGGVAEIYDSITNAKNDLAVAEKELESAKSEASKLYEMVKALAVATDLTPTKKAEKLNELSNSAKSLNEKVDGIREKITKAAGDIKSEGGKDDA